MVIAGDGTGSKSSHQLGEGETTDFLAIPFRVGKDGDVVAPRARALTRLARDGRNVNTGSLDRDLTRTAWSRWIEALAPPW